MGLLEQTGRYIFKREAYRAYRGVLNSKMPIGCFGNVINVVGISIWVFVAVIVAVSTNSYMFLSILPFIFTFITLVKVIRKPVKTTMFTYGTKPIRKTDRRYTGGYKIVHVNTITGEVPFSEDKLALDKLKRQKEIRKWLIINSALILIMVLTYFKTRNLI